MLQRIRVGPAPWKARFLLVATMCVATYSQVLASRYEVMAAELQEAAPADSRFDGGQLELDDLSRLDRRLLVEAVLARNPDAEAAREAWRAALAEYPQGHPFAAGPGEGW